MAIAFDYAARSDVGLTRSNNQDSGYAGPHLLVIADGMGGHAGGDIASSVAVDHLAPLDDDAHTAEQASTLMAEAIDAAHDDLLARVAAEPALAGLGTTITALLRTGNKLTLGHIGDSRAYLLREDECVQVTTDHTFVQHLVDSGKLTPEQAEHHPQRSLLLRVLGDVDLGTGLDISVREAKAGDRWLLCSDGLSSVVPFQMIADTLAGFADPVECAGELVGLALAGGGPDNVTCIVADVVDALGDGPAPATDPQVVGAAAEENLAPSPPQDDTTVVGPETRRGIARSHTPPRKGRRVIFWVVVLLVLAGLAGAGYFGYEWTQEQYYVGVLDGRVTIFQGIDQSVGPLSLSSPYERTDLSTDSLTPMARDRLDQTISADSLDQARQIVVNLRTDAGLNADSGQQ